MKDINPFGEETPFDLIDYDDLEEPDYDVDPDTMMDSDDDAFDLTQVRELGELFGSEGPKSYQQILHDAARRYIESGFAPVPVLPGGKRPLGKNWPERRITKEEVADAFSDEGNIGLILGNASNELVDVDLDCSEAVALASRFLPQTGMVCGRPGAPDSHRFYISPGIPTKKFNDPEPGNIPDATIVEIRSTGSSTVVPPSRTLVDKHGDDDGEREERAWTTDDLNPATLSNEGLLRSVSVLAATVLVARAWQRSKRHQTVLALAGALVHGGVPREQAIRIVDGICVITIRPPDR